MEDKKEEIIKQFQLMEEDAKKQIDQGKEKYNFMIGLVNESGNLVRKNPQLLNFITDLGKKHIESIAAYNSEKGDQ